MAVAIISVVVGLTPLAGALYLLLTIDTVLAGHNPATLGGVFAMAAVGLGLLTLLAMLRARMAAQLGAWITAALSARVDARLVHGRTAAAGGAAIRRGIDDLGELANRPAVTRGAGVLLMPIFLIALALLHGGFALVLLAGAAILTAVLLPAWRAGRADADRVETALADRDAVAALSARHVALVAMLGMGPQTEDARRRAQAALGGNRARLLAPARDRLAVAHGVRLLAIVATVTLGGALVIGGSASIGAMVAATLLVAQGLAPFEALIAEAPAIARARAGWARVATLLDAEAPPADPLPLPPAAARLEVEGLTLTVPEARRVIARDVSFALRAGDALAIVGPSASGKSALLRALIGGWPAAAGKVRLDGAALDQWAGAALGRQVGYLPQDAMLFEGSVAQNIARFDPAAGSDAVIAAATAAGVHDLIVRLPQGYATEVGVDGNLLSASERQRIALARALFGDPFLIVLDDPAAHLDAGGQPLLAAAITGARARGAIVVSTGNAPALIETASMLAVLRGGRLEDFGPRDEVRARLLKGPAAPARGGTAAMAPAEG